MSRRFPDRDRLQDLLSDQKAWFAPDVAQGLFDVGLLFEALAPVDQMGVSTRQLWRGTMRHYPSRLNGWHRAEDFGLFRVGELLASEGLVNSADTAVVKQL